MVGSLVRYKDTHEFFEKHYDEIQEIRDELAEQGVDVPIPTDTDLKNFLAWFGFEHRAYEVYNELEYDAPIFQDQ
jgi:DNA-binding ferritin-like protein